LRFIEFKRHQCSGFARALSLAEKCAAWDAYHRVFTRWQSGARHQANFEQGTEMTSSILGRASTEATKKRFHTWSSLVLHASQRDKKWASVLTQASKRQLTECLARGSSALRIAARLHYRRQVAKRAIQRAADRKERQCVVRVLSVWRSTVKVRSTKRRAVANVALLGQRKANEIAARRALRTWHSSLQSHATAEQRLKLLVAGATKTWLRERQRLRFVNWRRRVAALVKHEAAAKVLLHMLKDKVAGKQRRGWRALTARHLAKHEQLRAGRSIGLGGGAMSRALLQNQKRRLGRALACLRGHAASAARDARDSANTEVAMLRVVADEHQALQASNRTLQQEHGDLQSKWSALTAASTDTSQDLVTVREALEEEKALAAQRLSEIEAAASQAAVAAVEKAAREEVINDMKERLAAAAAAAEASTSERSALMEQLKAAAATAEELHSSHERKHASLKADAQAAAEKAQEALNAALAEAKAHATTCSATESKLREELAEHRTKVAAMETALATAAGQAGDLSGQRSQLTEDLSNLREAHSLASMKTVELTGKLEAAESAMEEVQARLNEDLRREREQHAAALQAEKERSAALGQEATEERRSKAQVEKELAAVSGDKRALEMQVQQSARAAEVDATERQALQAEAARLRQEMVELERAREAAARDGSGLQGQLANQSERGSALLQELSAAREELASLRAGERAHNATYENARQEIKELRAVERAYHELRAAASASAAEGEACAQSLATLQHEHARVARELEQARQRLESEAMRADESAASLAGARQELARLEGRCASLAAAQGPITELTERLMEQLKGKEADALQMGHLEELTQSLEHRCAEATHEGRRLNDTLNALADLATRAATHSQENLAATAADSPYKPQGDYSADPLGLSGSGQSFSFGGGGSDGVSRSLVRMDEGPSRSNSSLVGHASSSSSSSGGGAATARTAVEALARLVGRLTDKIEAGRRSHQARAAAEAQKVEALEGEVAASKERERAASAEAARLAAALAAKGRDVADAKSAVASADAAAATAAAAAADAGNRCADLSEQLAEAEAHTRRETAARAALEQERSRLTVAAATSSAEREELSRLLRSARLRAIGGSHARQQQALATTSNSHGEDGPSLVSMATELTLGLTQAEEDVEAAKAQSESLAAQLRSTGEELEQKRQALHEATAYGKAQTQKATSLATAEEARDLLAREVMNFIIATNRLVTKHE
jgi:chromosome segregation ATPase